MAFRRSTVRSRPSPPIKKVTERWPFLLVEMDGGKSAVVRTAGADAESARALQPFQAAAFAKQSFVRRDESGLPPEYPTNFYFSCTNQSVFL